MDQKEMFRQLVDFNKKAFENTFNGMVLFQDQQETMVNTLLEQATWLPQEGKKVVTEWMNAYKRSRDDFKKTVEEHFRKVEEYCVKMVAA